MATVRVTPAPAPRPPGRSRALAGVQKRRAEQLTSLFENGTTALQYAYAEDIHDGRGITAGRAGFTSGTDDLYEVVRDYVAKKPTSPLARYLPALKRLHELPDDSPERASTKGLEGFVAAWATAAKDPTLRRVQDRAVARLYFGPAEAVSDELGLQTPLARAELYDAIIQHGGGGERDGLGGIVRRASVRAGGTPAHGVDERSWLAAFLKERRATLEHANDPATREGWAESVDRVGVFEDLLRAGNLELKGPIRVNHGDFKGVVP